MSHFATSMLRVAFALYTITFCLGVTAQFRHTRFGKWHHIMFAFSVVGAAIAWITAPSWSLTAVLLCVAALPKTRPPSKAHTGLAICGFLGYVWTLWI